MKKNWLSKLIRGVLACSCALSFASCKDPVSSEKELLPTGEEKEVVKDESGKEVFVVSKGKSEYKIVIPESQGKYIKKAAEDMQKIKGWRKKKSGVAERENSCGNCQNVVHLRVRYRSFLIN